MGPTRARASSPACTSSRRSGGSSRHFAQKKRKALIVQATGTGKTRVAIALCDALIQARWAKRILFLCDRRELRKQAHNAFKEFLPVGEPHVRHRRHRQRPHQANLSGHLSVTIGWSNLLSAPFVRRYAVSLDETPVAEIRFEAGSPDCELLLNERHPTFMRNGEHSSLALWQPLEAEDLGEEPDEIQEIIHREFHRSKSPYVFLGSRLVTSSHNG